MKKTIMLAGGALVLAVASIGATVMLIDGPSQIAAAGGGAPAMQAAGISKALYYNVQPEFVVNLESPSSDRFLMVELAIAAYDQKQLDTIDDNMPELRNELLTLFARQKSQDLRSEEGKATLRQDAVAIIDALIEKHYGVAPVTDVFLTRFVMQ